jgi:hypothetical protein
MWQALGAGIVVAALALVAYAVRAWWIGRREVARHDDLARLAAEALDAQRSRTDDLRAIPDSERRLRATLDEYRRRRRDPAAKP